ncbi:IS200/IS605 family transposase, partial [Staphylococcus pseudintermedius]
KKRHFQTAIKQHFQTAIKQHFQTAIDTCKDHIHMLVSIPPKLSVSQLVGYLKGKSSLMIFDRHVHLKYRYGDRKFWCKGFYVDTVGRNRKVIEEYIRNQLQEDIVAEKRTMMEYIDSFTGEENKRLRKK